MEQVLKRPPWWAWFSLMGLEIPSAAIAWAFAVSQSHLVVVSSPWLYQFLFVAVWCVNMLDRVLKIFRGGSAVYTDECLLFAKKHCFVIPLLYRLSYRATCLHAERACGAESIILFPILQPQNIIFSTSLYFAALHSRNPPSQSGGSLRQNTAQQQWENQCRPG
jgi:hypothetical protein